MLLDLRKRRANEILLDFGAERVAQGMGIILPDDPQRARGCRQNDRFRFARIHRSIEPFGQSGKKSLFLLGMPVGLLIGAALAANGLKHAPWRVGADLARRRVLLLVGRLGAEFRIECRSAVFEYDGL